MLRPRVWYVKILSVRSSYKIHRRGGGSTNRSLGNYHCGHGLEQFLGQALRLGQARGPSPVARTACTSPTKLTGPLNVPVEDFASSFHLNMHLIPMKLM